jgi:hypothetical protein
MSGQRDSTFSDIGLAEASQATQNETLIERKNLGAHHGWMREPTGLPILKPTVTVPRGVCGARDHCEND